MPLSKGKDRERKREGRRRGTGLIPKAEVRRLRALGVDLLRAHKEPVPSLQEHRDLQRQLHAARERVEWNRAGTRYLRGIIAEEQTKSAYLQSLLDGYQASGDLRRDRREQEQQMGSALSEQPPLLKGEGRAIPEAREPQREPTIEYGLASFTKLHREGRIQEARRGNE